MLALALAAISTFALAGCSSPPPPVAEFSTTINSGNAPLDISFILGEAVDGDIFDWDFGDGFGSDEPEPRHTFQDAGSFAVRLTVTKGEQSSVATATISVEPGAAGWMVIEGGASAISSLGTTRFTASAFDELGNPIAGQEFNWSTDSAAGDIDDEGLFTAGADLGNFPDAISVEFERLGVTVGQKIGMAVVAGPMHDITVEPTEIEIGVGRDLQVSVRAVDEAGHVLDSARALFTALRQGDSISSSGLFTAGSSASGEDTELVSVEVKLDGKTIEATVAGLVRPGILDEVHVSSVPARMNVGESVQVDAYGTDRFGNRLDLDELRWSVTDPGIGSVTESGLFTAGTAAGSYFENGLTARGFLDRVEAVTVAPLSIAAGPAVSISIVPDGDSVPIGAGSPFVVVARDTHGNRLELDADDFEYQYSIAGRGNGAGVFIAGYELGDFENAITVKLPPGVAGNADELVAQSDISIRQRSSNMVAIEVADQDGGTIMLIDLETAEFGPASPSFAGNGEVELAPSWWPDGSRLVYTSTAAADLQVHTLDLDLRRIVQLTSIPGGVSMPEISPDGNSIVFVHLETEAWQLYVAPIPEDAATNPITLADATLVSVDESAKHMTPHWSPDGSQLLVSVSLPDDRISMVLFDPTLKDDPITIGPFGTVGFGWTADGNGVHFGRSNSTGALDLGTLDLSTGTPKFVNTSLDFRVAAWAPDDSELMAIDTRRGAAWFLDSDSTGTRRAVDPEQKPARMSWRPREYGDPVAGPDLGPGPEAGRTMLEAGDAPAPPVGSLDTGLSYSAVISTDLGEITIDLFADLAPLTVENFINLSRIGYYDGLQFHRVVPGFISQAGETSGGSANGPGYLFNDEFSRELLHDSAGVVSMANAGANTNSSQFFITHNAAPELDAYDGGVKKNCADDAISCHSVFGAVTGGLEIVTGMKERDPATATTPGLTILSVLILES